MGHGPSIHERPRKKEECRRKIVQDSAQWTHTEKRRMATSDYVSGHLIPTSPTGAPLHIEDDFMARLSLAEKRDEQRMSPTTSSRSGLLIPGQEDIEFLGPLALGLARLTSCRMQIHRNAWSCCMLGADSYKKRRRGGRVRALVALPTATLLPPSPTVRQCDCDRACGAFTLCVLSVGARGCSEDHGPMFHGLRWSEWGVLASAGLCGEYS